MAYFDFETTSAMGIDDQFFLKDLAQRKITFNVDFSPESVAAPIEMILQFNREDIDIDPDKRKPILLYLSSDGGDVDSGFALIDVIEESKTPIYTINTGWLYSMGFLVGIAGHKRYAFKNSKFLMHDGRGLVYDSQAKMQDFMRFQRNIEERTKNFVLYHTNLGEDEYEEKRRVEWYMFADEAKERGIVDYIIGEDCSIDEIV